MRDAEPCRRDTTVCPGGIGSHPAARGGAGAPPVEHARRTWGPAIPPQAGRPPRRLRAGRRAALAPLATGIILLALCGCNWPGAGRRPAVSSIPPPPNWKPLEVTHVRLGIEPLGTIPNSGLVLPAVSPDGQWIAYLAVRPEATVYLRAALDGRGLSDVSLAIRRTQAGAAPRIICPSGAGWPAWSPDGRQVAFVAADPNGHCALGLHDPAAGTTRKVSPGARWLMMTAFSPGGERLAVAVPGDVPGQARLHVLDLSSSRLTPAPADANTAWQVWPVWRSPQMLVFLRRSGQVTGLGQWTVGGPQAEPLAAMPAPADLADACQTFAGITRPLAPGGRLLACYHAGDDRLAVLDLAGGPRRSLPEHTRAGCWLGERHLLAATDDNLLLVDIETGQFKRLISGRWLPLWADDRTRQAIVCTARKDPGTFDLIRLQLLPE